MLIPVGHNKFNILSVPPDLVGRWHNTSGNAVPYVRFEASGIYLVSSEPALFSITPDGLQLDWEGSIWSRKYGQGQDIKGVWTRNAGAPGEEEIYFQDSHGTFYSDGANFLVGVWDVAVGGTLAGGTLVYEERRAVFDVTGNTIIFFAVFGGREDMTYAINGDVLTLTSTIGEDFLFTRV